MNAPDITPSVSTLLDEEILVSQLSLNSNQFKPHQEKC